MIEQCIKCKGLCVCRAKALLQRIGRMQEESKSNVKES
ncbi:hypothetical protein RCIP0080_00002 [Klebsiella phage RCIP0080]|nr:hypothetical protein AXX01_00057 [Acinetobacter phage JC1]